MRLLHMQSLWWTAAGCTMLHFLWLGTLIGILALLVRQFLRHARVSTRYGFTICCMLTLAATPCVLFVDIVGRMQHEQTASRAAREDRLTAEDMDALRQARSRSADHTDLADSTAEPSADSPTGTLRWAERIVSASPFLPWVWLAGSTVFFTALLTGLAEMVRIKRRTRPMCDTERPAIILRELAGHLGVGRIRLAVTEQASSPSLFGVLRPAILLPESAVTRWSEEQLRMVLLHELWHVKRRDHLVNLGQRLIETLLFFHPAVWRVSAWVRTEREYACDAAVLQHLHQPFAYARMLAGFAGVSPVRDRLAVAMGEHDLVARISKVLDQDRSDRGVRPVLMSVLVFLAGTFSLAYAGFARPGWIVVPVVAASTGETSLNSGSGAITAGPNKSVGPSDRQPANAVGTGVMGMDAANTADHISVRIVDEEGAPVAGAHLGIRARWDHDQFGFQSEAADVRSDAGGIARIESRRLLKPAAGCDVLVPCLVYHEQRQLAATLHLILARDWGKTLVVTLRPVVRVTLTLGCDALEGEGRSMAWSKAFVRLPGNSISYLLRDTRSAPHRFEYPLPPGRYELVAFGGSGRDRSTSVLVQPFVVAADENVADLGVIQLSAREEPVPFAGKAGRASGFAGQTSAGAGG